MKKYTIKRKNDDNKMNRSKIT